ncbi:MAG: ClbS/DfsB family four-helix bundle protein [Patescibacteria group bacterium]
MLDLIENYKQARMDFLVLVQRFPKDQRNASLMGGMSLKDLLVHLASWDLLYADHLEEFSQGINPTIIEDKDTLNAKFLEEGKDQDWEESYENLLESGAVFIETLKEFPTELETKFIYEGYNITPKDLVIENINHYSKEHLALVESISI